MAGSFRIVMGVDENLVCIQDPDSLVQFSVVLTFPDGRGGPGADLFLI